MANGNDPETVFMAVCVEVAAKMDEAEADVIFDKNWPREEAKIKARVAIVEENAARLRALNAPVDLDFDVIGQVIADEEEAA